MILTSYYKTETDRERDSIISSVERFNWNSPNNMNIFCWFRKVLQRICGDIDEPTWPSHSIMSIGLCIQSACIITARNLVAMQFNGFRYKWQIKAMRTAYSNETHVNRLWNDWNGKAAQPRSKITTTISIESSMRTIQFGARCSTVRMNYFACQLMWLNEVLKYFSLVRFSSNHAKMLTWRKKLFQNWDFFISKKKKTNTKYKVIWSRISIWKLSQK